MNKITDDQMAQAEKQLKFWESMINSMTPKERETPELLAKSPSRRRRIARGSGRKDLDVSNMIGQFTAARSMMQNMSKMMKMQGAKGELLSVQLAALDLIHIANCLTPFQIMYPAPPHTGVQSTLFKGVWW